MGEDVEVKLSDLNTESSIFDLRAESVIGDPALRSGAFFGGIFHYLSPPQHLQPTEAEKQV